ncbi:unnamed protein product [Rotaria sordida]|uniref:DNA-dependent protein kinase catalytic subunit CC3 domain-containing protein n=1 Tax=Rotaria sordida TaxID=392033 RepID=A0A816BK95_9BILA|nr:unnamed protein product [Rotaria sordida]CAF1370741.1 unnamed protein product [Rotaria sordida]CAF1611522.1 unnamed protein product [Rotaria sordida]CAF4158145.1 unnamed protein product [Rotaria sordida]
MKRENFLNVEIPIPAIQIGPTFDGKELTKHIITRARAQFVDGRLMKSMDVMLAGINTNDKQIKLHLIHSLAASSFNCLISLLIYTQTEALLYKAFIFNANPAKDEYIFENIIDPDYKYKFPLELERYNAKDKRTLLNILCKKILTTSKSDNSLHQQQHLSSTPRYLSSQYLFGTSLTDELAVFDFTSAAVNQQQNDLNKKPVLIEGSDDEIASEFIDMKMDELNLHPCMIPMVCLLKHMETNGIIPINDHISDRPPSMICIYKKCSNPLI